MKDTIELFRDEVETTLRVFYSYQAADQLLKEEKYVILVNENVHFWRLFLSSIQTKLFIAIGRLYDKSKDTFSFSEFKKKCIEEIDSFSKDALRERRYESYAEVPEWLEKYLQGAHDPTEDEFRELFKLAEPFDEQMESIRKNIRHRVFAHAVHTDKEVINKHLSKTSVVKIEEALVVLWSIYNQLFQLFNNGKAFSFELKEYPYKEEVFECVKKAMGDNV